jgi:hypothetical protein
MKEKLVVKNFSVLDDVEIDINKINILIGPQSTGKSIIAKLVYFFRTIHNPISRNIFNSGGKKQLSELLRFQFNTIFPEYLIQRRTFEVIYYYGDQSISITNKGAKSHKSFKISYSDSILKEIAKIKKEYQKAILSNGINTPHSPEQIRLSTTGKLTKFLHGTPGQVSSFIPAGRSFFANIEKNIFTLIGRSSPIDQMLIEFGSFYEIIRERFLAPFPTPKDSISDELYRTCIDVLGGQYEYRNNFDYLKITDDWKILLRDASSGQQAVAPLIISLLTLSISPLALSRIENIYISIEEPEAHIFPESQWKIVQIIAMVYNLLKRQSTFFITTHSPYILTSFNHLLQAENTYNDIREKFGNGLIDEERKNQLDEQLGEIISSNKRVAFEDVSVYSVKKGKCKDIRNKENKLIDANEIDEVSETTSTLFDRMLEISYGE